MSKYFDTKPGSLEELYPLLKDESQSPKRRKVRNQRTKTKDSFLSLLIAKQRKMVKRNSPFGKEYEVEKVECPKCEGKGCEHCENKGYT